MDKLLSVIESLMSRKENEFSEISQVYFRAGGKEVTELRPNRSVKITDHFTCISTNVIYCKTYTLCKKIYIGETGRRLADRFREHLRDVEKNNTDASKPVGRHFNLPNHSHHNMTNCRLSLHHGNTGNRKSLEQKFIFQLGTLSQHRINERLSFH